MIKPTIEDGYIQSLAVKRFTNIIQQAYGYNAELFEVPEHVINTDTAISTHIKVINNKLFKECDEHLFTFYHVVIKENTTINYYFYRPRQIHTIVI